MSQSSPHRRKFGCFRSLSCKMRILCLHQWATSGLIFEKAGHPHWYARPIARVGLHKVAGELEVNPSTNPPFPPSNLTTFPDVPNFVPGPYYSLYEGLSSHECKEPHGIITETIAEEGPFNNVVSLAKAPPSPSYTSSTANSRSVMIRRHSSTTSPATRP